MIWKLENCFFNVYLVFVRIYDSLIDVVRDRDVWLWSYSHTNTRLQVYIVLNVIEVINCKLIWMPAGNKKTRTMWNISRSFDKNFVFCFKRKEKKK
jgi:hypothetical protein